MCNCAKIRQGIVDAALALSTGDVSRAYEIATDTAGLVREDATRVKAQAAARLGLARR